MSLTEIQPVEQQTNVHNIEVAREQVRHANRILDDIEDLNEIDFETLGFVVRSLLNAEKQLTTAIEQNNKGFGEFPLSKAPLPTFDSRKDQSK